MNDQQAAQHTGSQTRPRLVNVRGFVAALALVALFGGVASPLASTFIAAHFPNRPMPPDLLFEILPYVGWARYLTAVTFTLSAVLFAIHAIRRTPDRLADIAGVFAVMYFFRSVIMVLTPLADAYGPGAFVFPLEQHGMFPSGHVAAMVVFTRLTDASDAPGLRRVLIALTVVCSVAMILAHGHYSIDVVGGLLLGYFVEKEWTDGSLFGPFKRFLGCA